MRLRIEIDGNGRAARPAERTRQVERGGRLADTPLLIEDGDDTH
jgi:hypothetical protein